MGLAQSISYAMYVTNKLHTGDHAIVLSLSENLLYTIVMSLYRKRMNLVCIILSGYPFPQ